MLIEFYDANGDAVTRVGTDRPATEMAFFQLQFPQIVGWRTYEPPGPSLETLQAAAWESVKARRLAEDANPVEYGGKLLDFDGEAREKIRTAREALETAAKIGQAVESFDWTCYDGTIKPMTLADFEMIPLLVAIRSDANHKKARTLHTLIFAAESAAELSALPTWEEVE